MRATDQQPIVEDHDRGLEFDLGTLLTRRSALLTLSGAGLMALVGCGARSDDSATVSSASPVSTSIGTDASASTLDGVDDSTTCAVIPSETAGPYPGDGSNGPDVLAQSGVIRSDLRSSFGDASGVATGVATTVRIRIVNTADNCAPYEGAAVYLWHANQDGEYSMYTGAAKSQNYLRGVQVADADGYVTFTTTFPGCYDGRWPHMHFEIYKSADDALAASGKLKTSQLAVPQETCELVYATDGYETSVDNLTRVSLESDMVFRDGYALELAKASGAVADGITLTLTAAV